MKTNIRYNDPDRKKNDAEAVADIKQYLGTKPWEALLFEAGRAYQAGTADAFQSLNYAMGFAGIEGYPVHAFGRTYCLAAYRAWMHTEVQTDDEGFRIEEKTDV